MKVVDMGVVRPASSARATHRCPASRMPRAGVEERLTPSGSSSWPSRPSGGAERVAFNEMFAGQGQRQRMASRSPHKLDRVCRNMRDAVRLQELEDACGVQLAFVDNQFGPGAAGALSFNVMAAVAQYYSDNLRSEVLKGMDEKVRQGWPTGHAPYGYVNVADKDEPVQPHPTDSKTLARLFELFASGQHTFESLAQKMADEGRIYRPSTPRFNRSSLSHIFANRFYAGELVRNGQVFPGRYKLVIDRRTFDLVKTSSKRFDSCTGNPEIEACRAASRGAASVATPSPARTSGASCSTATVTSTSTTSAGTTRRPRTTCRSAGELDATPDRCRAGQHPHPGAAHPDVAAQNTIEEKSSSDLTTAEAERRARLGKRRTELVAMQDRLDAFLRGAVDEAAFGAKSGDLKAQIAEVERQLDGAGMVTEENGRLALQRLRFRTRTWWTSGGVRTSRHDGRSWNA